MPLAATAPNLPQHPYVGGGASPFLGGASPIPLVSPAPGGEPGLLTAASPAAAAAAGLTPVVPNNLMGAQAMKLPVSVPTTLSLVHPTTASPSAANMFGNAPSPHASFLAAAAVAGQQAKMVQDRCKPDRVDVSANSLLVPCLYMYLQIEWENLNIEVYDGVGESRSIPLRGR